MFNDFNVILTEATPVRSTHDKLCLSPAMFYLSALQYMGAMEFTFEHEDIETVAFHLSEEHTRDDQRAWVEEIEAIARATYAAHHAKDAQTYTFPRAQYFTRRVDVGHGVAFSTLWVKWEFSVY
jgi:hypothetical protein